MNKTYIALGSNIRPRRFFIESAIKKIQQEKAIALKRRSSMYDTFPVDCPAPGANRFLNGVIEVETSLSPDKLFSKLLRIEKSLGRRRQGKNSPRTIDLDILLYGNRVIHNDKLVIPHPRMHRRDFVMFGMNEIAPWVRHPVLGKTIEAMHKTRQMKIVEDPKQLYRHISSLKQKGRRIGLVPTMGYLHEGHLSLIRKARRENDIVIVSVFVNPAQFGPREDYKKYPRDFQKDKALAKREKVDIIFSPRAKDIYMPNHSTYVDVGSLGENLCGRFRPEHFRGVATIVAKLFNIIPADNAYFGQKDAQQVFILKRMVRDLNIPVKIKMLPIVREKDGLAMSSRNTYLTKKERGEAIVLFRSLLLAKKLIKKGERKRKNIVKPMRDLIRNKSSARIEYISIVDTEEFKDLKILKDKALIAIAARFGKTRLIDNMILKIRNKG